MATYSTKLHMTNSSGTQQTAEIYTTVDEAGSNHMRMGSYYVPLVETSHENATIGRVTTASGTTFAIGKYRKGAAYAATLELETPLWYRGAASVGDYGLFAGGSPTTLAQLYANVDAVNSSLTLSKATDLSVARNNLSGASVGNYALFGGGMSEYGYVWSAVVDAYNASLTRSIPTALSVARAQIGTVTVGGKYALFAGGNISTASNTSYSPVVDAYNASLTRTVAPSLQATQYKYFSDRPAAAVGNYGIFPGYGGNAYDTSLTQLFNTFTCYASDGYTGASTENHAVFIYNSSTSTPPYAYDASLTQSKLAATSYRETKSRNGASVKGCAVFAGFTTYVQIYDKDLVYTSFQVSSGIDRSDLQATSVGMYALFGGGEDTTSRVPNINAIRIA